MIPTPRRFGLIATLAVALLSACAGPATAELVPVAASSTPAATGSATGSPSATPSETPSATVAPSTSRGGPSTTGTTTVPLPTCVAPVANPGARSGISAFGDSVMNGAKPQLTAQMPGILIDASGSQQLNRDLAPRIRSQHRNGTLGSIVVIHAGHNGSYTAADVDCLLDELGDRNLVVLLTIRSKFTSQQNRNNAALWAGAAGHSNAKVADWYACASANPGWTSSDLIHLNPAGREPYAKFIRAAIHGGPSPCTSAPTPSAEPTAEPTEDPAEDPAEDPTEDPTGDPTGEVTP